MKRLLFTAATAIAISTAAFIPGQAMAASSVTFVIGTPPPPVRYEVVPHLRRGYEWVPGYWNWNGRRHVWVPGHRERVRVGHYYQRPEWRQGSNGWELHRGGWQRGDRDHDGIPNRMDPTPNGSPLPVRRDRDGDGVPNRVDRDRDGDGIPNRVDPSPNGNTRRDRDGDGVPNRDDSRPDDARRN